MQKVKRPQVTLLLVKTRRRREGWRMGCYRMNFPSKTDIKKILEGPREVVSTKCCCRCRQARGGLRVDPVGCWTCAGERVEFAFSGLSECNENVLHPSRHININLKAGTFCGCSRTAFNYSQRTDMAVTLLPNKNTV